MLQKTLFALFAMLALWGANPSNAGTLPFIVPTGPAVGTSNAQMVCLADALQYEGRNSTEAYASVAMSIFARVESGQYGPDVCHVVYAYRVCGKGKCSKNWYYDRNTHKKGAVAQFSYTTSGKRWPWLNGAAHRKLWFNTTLPLATRLYADWLAGKHTVAPTVQQKYAGCDFFHTTSTKPGWRKKFRLCGEIGGHYLYASNAVKTRAPLVDEIITSSVKLNPLPPLKLDASTRQLASN